MEKMNLNMNINELKELFDKFSLVTLDSIDIMLSNIKKYDLTETNIVLKKVYEKKYSDVKNRLGACDSYDEVYKLLNFSLNEIINDVSSLNEEELTYLKKIMDEALLNFNNAEEKVINSITRCRDAIYMELVLIHKTLELNSDELEVFFNKYNSSELSFFEELFDYVSENDLSKIMSIFNKIKEEKKNEVKNICDSNEADIDEIISKIDLLSEKEIYFFYNLVSDASFYLSCIRDNESVYTDEYDNFSLDDYPILPVFELEEVLRKRIDDQVNNCGKKVKKYSL